MAGEFSLLELLQHAQDLGFLGPGDVGRHRDHALGYGQVLGEGWSGRAMDLGSGGGVPGLVLAMDLPDSRWTLLDAQAKRATFLTSAVRKLGLEARVAVAHERAEVLARAQGHRSSYDLVVARSFAIPAATAECAGPFLRRGGRLLVSEPPDEGEDRNRWPSEGLEKLHLTLEEFVPGPPALAVMRSTDVCPEKYPRRIGLPTKRPLW